MSALGSFENAIMGKLFLSASTTPCNTLLPKLIKKFSEIYPDIRYEIKEHGSSDIIKDILNLDSEIGFVGTDVVDDKVNCYPLKEDELVVISHPSLDLPKEISIDRLLDMKLIVRDINSGTRKTFEKELLKHRLSLSKLNIICEASNLDTLIQCVKANIGIAIVSKAVSNQYVDIKLLKQSSIVDMDLIRNIYLIINSKRTLTPTAKAFLSLCSQEFGLKLL